MKPVFLNLIDLSIHFNILNMNITIKSVAILSFVSK